MAYQESKELQHGFSELYIVFSVSGDNRAAHNA